ncbi:2-keto-4-pentenoate hydratase [Nocardioides sp. SLBN-35]|uniref:2-keto-4-pentenoate hydratase n=1 Tax=Nocardioides sp. SLBN-35 TaxID=2768445 RepID=UPI0011507372|nr:fumarylacetoacetate hydrolase family protein [Nocardioides sp. SLBN-35]TQK68927.1 2-oxo-3-hexenedioate decarboxylase [Nocardioides sp. SLBN-35]
MPDIEALARELDEAVRTATAVRQLSAEVELTLDQAYAVQAAGVRLREARGDAVVGAKLGFTSRAKAEQMGVSDVIIGVLHASMQTPDGGRVDLAAGVHPRVEPEVAFRLGAAIDPLDDDADILAATVAVAPALEIIDSRYRDFRFSLTDVVADNTSASSFVVGPWRSFADARAELDLAALDVTLTVGGEQVARGSSADILGDPVLALAAVKRMAREHGVALPAGSIILAGAATAAVALTPGASVEAVVGGLGPVRVTTSGGEQ